MSIDKKDFLLRKVKGKFTIDYKSVPVSSNALKFQKGFFYQLKNAYF